jgi:hypothetical protein
MVRAIPANLPCGGPEGIGPCTPGTEEERRVDGVLAREKRTGL